MLRAEHLVLADVGAVYAIAAGSALEQPPAALRRRAPNAPNPSGDLFGEALPDGIDQPERAVCEQEPSFPRTSRQVKSSENAQFHGAIGPKR